jgi:transposase
MEGFMEGRYVGIDLAKRTMEVCIVSDGEEKIERHGLKTDAKGRDVLCRLLRKSDKVAVEVCGFANSLVRQINREVGSRVYMLNPGKLQVIWRSTKKTDKEDSLKLARFIQRNPEEELPEVPLVSEKEEEMRSMVSMEQFLTKNRVAAVNRLHALYTQAGIVDVEKKDLQTGKRRAERMKELPEGLRYFADLLEKELELLESQLEEVKEKLAVMTRENELAPYVMSIPGVGIGLAAVFLAYLGDGSRFSSAAEVANYAGFTPRVDCSGETNHYGSISKWSYCHAIRAVTLQGVWAMTRSNYGGMLQAKFNSLAGRMNRRKSAVAVARKMVSLAWLLMRRREFYNASDRVTLEKKFKLYKIKFEEWGSCA